MLCHPAVTILPLPGASPSIHSFQVKWHNVSYDCPKSVCTSTMCFKIGLVRPGVLWPPTHFTLLYKACIAITEGDVVSSEQRCWDPWQIVMTSDALWTHSAPSRQTAMRDSSKVRLHSHEENGVIIARFSELYWWKEWGKESQTWWVCVCICQVASRA